MISSFGPGVMIIDMPSIPRLFFQEVMRPLYLFIIFSCALWMYEAYYYYSSVIIVTGLVGIITNLYQTYQNKKRINEMAYHEETINSLRSGEVIQISSADLAPGDIVFLKNQIKIPFDGIILEGDALIN
jgi:magnesium-transporting ATPase (P-type)